MQSQARVTPMYKELKLTKETHLAQLHCLKICVNVWRGVCIVKRASKAKFFSSNCVGRGVVGGSNIQRKHGAVHGAEIQTKFLLQTFEGKPWHLHIISWVRRTRDITGFLSEPSYAMILTKMAKFVTIFRCVYKHL